MRKTALLLLAGMALGGCTRTRIVEVAASTTTRPPTIGPEDEPTTVAIAPDTATSLVGTVATTSPTTPPPSPTTKAPATTRATTVTTRATTTTAKKCPSRDVTATGVDLTFSRGSADYWYYSGTGRVFNNTGVEIRLYKVEVDILTDRKIDSAYLRPPGSGVISGGDTIDVSAEGITQWHSEPHKGGYRIDWVYASSEYYGCPTA